MPVIEVRNVKNIDLLTFQMPPVGVFVLTGENGCGKTSLLACINRLGQRDSFPRHFRTSQASKQLDKFDSSVITYVGNAKSVSYRYGGTRWDPTPKVRGDALLADFGYASVVYIAADETRVTPRQDDFRPNRVKVADKFIVDRANRIFGTNKFDRLRTVNVKKGPGQQAFLFEVPKLRPPAEYYSERNFSLGELAVLKLLRALMNLDPRTLVIIDELELALHPVAQARLLEVIQEIAKPLEHTVIFSTHSATLIRSTPPSRLLFLEKTSGKVECVRDCFPTYALGRIGNASDLTHDVVLLVEDLHAEAFVRAMLPFAANKVFKSIAHPSIGVAPIGGYGEVLKFQARASNLFPSTTRIRSLLDKDCEALLVPGMSAPPPPTSNQATAQRNFQALKKEVLFLPDTPEVGLANALASKWPDAALYLNGVYFNNAILTFSAPLFSGTSAAKVSRDEAKGYIDKLYAALQAAIGRPKNEFVDTLFKWYVAAEEKASPGWAASAIALAIK